MKIKSNRTISVLFLVIVIKAQGQTIIKGSFSSFPSATFTIVANQSALNDYRGEQIAGDRTSDKGEFSVSVQLNKEQPLLLYIDRFFYKLWIVPNTDLAITETSDGNFSFSGPSGKQNLFFLRSGLMKPYTVPPNAGTAGFEPGRQTAYLDSIETKRLMLFDEFFAKTNLSSVFVSYCKAEILHFTLLNKSQYPMMYVASNTLKMQDIPADYYQFWSRFKLFEDSCMSDAYQYSIRDYAEYNARKKLPADNSSVEELNKGIFASLDSLLEDRPYSLQMQKTGTLLFMIRYLDLPVLTQQEIEMYTKQFPASTSLGLIRQEWDKKNSVGLVVPAFSLKDVSGNDIDIKSFRGKVVYIDFWGSWCKACLLQMPNSARVQQQFKGKDVVFLFIDFYDTNEKWLKAIRDKKIAGMHVKAEKTDEAYFEKVFGISQGFPRYALVDKSGKLITTAAPHPGDEGIYTFIEKYLKGSE